MSPSNVRQPNGGSKAQSRNLKTAPQTKALVCNGPSTNVIDTKSDPSMMSGSGKYGSMPWLQKQTINEQSAPNSIMRLRLQQAGEKQLGQMSDNLGQWQCVSTTPPAHQPSQFPANQQDLLVPVGLQRGLFRGPIPSKIMASELHFPPAATGREQMHTRPSGDICPPVKQTPLSAAAAPWVPQATDQIKRNPASSKVPPPAPDRCIRDMPLPKFLFASAPTSPASLSPAKVTPRSITPPPGLLQPPGPKIEEDDWILIAMGDEGTSTERPLSEEPTEQGLYYTQWNVPAQHQGHRYGQMKYEFDPNATAVHTTMSL